MMGKRKTIDEDVDTLSKKMIRLRDTTKNDRIA